MKKSGFSFLELLIALSLFSVGMVSILQIFPLNRRYLAQSAAVTQASFLGQAEIETVRATDYDSLIPGTFEPQHSVSNDASDPLSQFERSTVITLIDKDHHTTATDVGLKKVEVTVYWSERGINRQYSLTTYASNR